MTYRWLRELADILRAAGLTVVEYPGWHTRGRPYDGGARPFEPRAVMLHHDASATGPSPGMARYIAETGRPGIPAPLAQCWVDTAGRWHVLAAGRANHAGEGAYGALLPTDQGNRYALGVETDHTTGEPWAWAQLHALLSGTAAICRYLDVGAAAVLGHKEYTTRKTDPDGIDMTNFRFDVAELLEADMPTAAEIAAAVWSHPIAHVGTTDKAAASTHLRYIRHNVGELNTALAQLPAQVAAAVLAAAPPGTPLDPAAVGDELEARLRAVLGSLDQPNPTP